MAPAAAVPRMHTQWHGSCVASSGTHMEGHISGSISPRPGCTQSSQATAAPCQECQQRRPSPSTSSDCGQSATPDACGRLAAPDWGVDANRAAWQLCAVSYRVQNIDVDASAIV